MSLEEIRIIKKYLKKFAKVTVNAKDEIDGIYEKRKSMAKVSGGVKFATTLEFGLGAAIAGVSLLFPPAILLGGTIGLTAMGVSGTIAVVNHVDDVVKVDNLKNEVTKALETFEEDFTGFEGIVDFMIKTITADQKAYQFTSDSIKQQIKKVQENIEKLKREKFQTATIIDGKSLGQIIVNLEKIIGDQFTKTVLAIAKIGIEIIMLLPQILSALSEYFNDMTRTPTSFDENLMFLMKKFQSIRDKVEDLIKYLEKLEADRNK